MTGAIEIGDRVMHLQPLASTKPPPPGRPGLLRCGLRLGQWHPVNVSIADDFRRHVR